MRVFQGARDPLAARIVALADVYNALTSPRVCKPAYEPEQARRIILDESGAHFDPAMVEAFSACFDAMPLKCPTRMRGCGCPSIAPPPELAEAVGCSNI